MISWVEVDATNMVSGIKGKSSNSSVDDPIIGYINGFVFRGWVVNYHAIPRDRNMVTHTLAAVAFSYNEESVRLDSKPASIATLL